MAQVFSTGFAPVAPVTPVKLGTNVQTSEVSPDSTPAPKYSTAYAPPEPIMGVAAGYGGKNLHPTLPIGNVFIDIRNHLSCHSIFNANIETLLEEYLTMKSSLDTALTSVAKLEREVKRERREKEAYKAEALDLKRALVETQANLDQTRAELSISQEKLALAVKQLMEVSSRLEEVKTQLRLALRERDELARELEVKEGELQFYKKRTVELEHALALANKGENDANDRNVRLTQLLYQIERQKAEIERARDLAEKRLREADEEVENGGSKYKDVIEDLRKCVAGLELEIILLQVQRQEIGKVAHDREVHILKLDKEIFDAKELKLKYRELVRQYDQLITKYKGSRSVPKNDLQGLIKNRVSTIGKAEADAIARGLPVGKPIRRSGVTSVNDVANNDDGSDAEQEVEAEGTDESVKSTAEPATETAIEPTPAEAPAKPEEKAEEKVEEKEAPAAEQPTVKASEEPIMGVAA